MVFLFVFANQNSRPSSPFGFVGEVPTRSESSPAPADLPPRSVCLPRLGRGPELLGELLGALDRSFLGVTLNLQLSTFNRVFFSPSSPHLCALCVRRLPRPGRGGENSSSFRSSLIPRHSPLTTNSFIIRTSKTPLPQLLYNPHLQTPLGSAGNKGLITPLESALTRNSPVSRLESALAKRWGWGPCFPLWNSPLTTRHSPDVLGLHPDAISEHSSQLEEPLAVAGIPNTAADEERAHDRLGQKARSHIVRESAPVGHAIHLAKFVGPHGVHLFADKGWQREQVMEKAPSEQVILVPVKLILTIGAETHRPAQEELRNSRIRRAKRAATFALHENGRGPRNRLEISQLQIHGREAARGSRALVEPPEIRFRAKTTPRNHGIVGVVQEVMQPALPHATFYRRNLRCSQTQLCIKRTDLESHSQLAEAPEAQSQVAPDVDAIDAVIRQRVGLCVDLKRRIAGIGMRRKEPPALRLERPVQFGLNPVGVPQQQIGAPFRSKAGHVHERVTRARGEIHIAALRPVHLKGHLNHGRRVIFLDHLHEQPRPRAFFGKAVPGRVIAAYASHPRQHLVEFLGVERSAWKRFQVAANVSRAMLIGSLNVHELWRGDFGPFACRARLEIFLPARIIESECGKQARSFLRRFIAFLHDRFSFAVVSCVVLSQMHGNDRVRLGHAA